MRTTTEIPDDPSAFPPTILQGAGTGTAFPPTVQQGVPRQAPGPQVPGSDFPATFQQGIGGEAGSSVSSVPDELLRSYEQLELIGSGTEGIVWLVRRRTDGAEFALKLYRSGAAEQTSACMAILGQLRNADFRRYVPEIEDCGVAATAAGSQVWVVMEYLPAGTLSALIKAERVGRGGVPQARAKQIVVSLAGVIHFWQDTIKMNPLDLKPANFMVRDAGRAELVVADFGGAVRMTLSQQYGSVLTTLAYMPPEGLAEWHSEPWPWWALGEIAHELITGRARFDLGDVSSSVTERLIRQERAVGRPDLSKVADERWRLLISGLLTRQPSHRWTFEQVTQWSEGQSPVVIADASGPGHTGPAKPPIVFASRSYHEPADLAAAMTAQPDEAASWLEGPGRDILLRWLDSDPKDTAFPREYLYGFAGSGNERRAHKAVTAFAVTFLPGGQPQYRGSVIDQDGLLELVRLGSKGAALLTEILAEGILPIAAGVGCQHDGCPDRCAVVDRLATEVPKVVTGVQDALSRIGDQVRSAGDGTAWMSPSGSELDTIRALAVELTIAPEHKSAVIKSIPSARVHGFAWLSDAQRVARHADARRLDGRVAVITAATLPTRAAAVEGARRGRVERARQARNAPRHQTDMRMLRWAIALIVTAAAPLGLGDLWWRDHLMSVTSLPPPDVSAIPGGAAMIGHLPEYVFGTLVLTGLLGLVFLRPPWPAGRAGIVMAGLVLAGAGASAVPAANATADRLDTAGQHAYQTGPVPISVLGTTCGDYWTSDLPVDGSYARWALAGQSDGDGDCGAVVGYAGWSLSWQVPASRNEYFAALASYSDNLLVAEETGQSVPGRLVGINDAGGKTLWSWRCPGRASISGVTFHGVRDRSQYSSDRPYVEVSCQDESGNDRDVRMVPADQRR